MLKTIMQVCSTDISFVQKRFTATVDCDEFMWNICVTPDITGTILYTRSATRFTRAR
jgi:hypothetical protein